MQAFGYSSLMETDTIELVAFDLDDTLAPSKSSLPPEVAEVLATLLRRVPVCVISGGNLSQFETQLLTGLDLPQELARSLHLMPTCGTQYLLHGETGWESQYRESLSDSQKERAAQALEEQAKVLGFWEDQTWGPIIEDRDTQITFSALGQKAPLDAKQKWDPYGKKKAALAQAVAPLLPDLEVRGGGSTSIDITAKGVDKAYGMAKLVEKTGIPAKNMLFIGDRLDEGGNDYPVKAAGWPTRSVSGWQDTVTVIRELLDDPRLAGAAS